jgi:hypothetical protein
MVGAGGVQAVNVIARMNNILIAAMILFCIFPPVLGDTFYLFYARYIAGLRLPNQILNSYLSRLLSNFCLPLCITSCVTKSLMLYLPFCYYREPRVINSAFLPNSPSRSFHFLVINNLSLGTSSDTITAKRTSMNIKVIKSTAFRWTILKGTFNALAV